METSRNSFPSTCEQEIDHWEPRFPEGRQRSAVIAALHAVQHENHGYLTAELMNAVADYLDLPTIQVYEVATFYSMFETGTVGRNEVAICTNISCMLRGADDIVEHVENKLGIKLGESTRGRANLPEERRGMPRRLLRRADDDGRHKYHENLTTEQVDEILDGLD